MESSRLRITTKLSKQVENPLEYSPIDTVKIEQLYRKQ